MLHNTLQLIMHKYCYQNVSGSPVELLYLPCCDGFLGQVLFVHLLMAYMVLIVPLQ